MEADRGFLLKAVWARLFPHFLMGKTFSPQWREGESEIAHSEGLFIIFF